MMRPQGAFFTPFKLSIVIVLVLSALNGLVAAQQDTSCDVFKPCKSGCCSKEGQCGFGPEYCGDGCQGTCDALAECGKYAAEEKFQCPLNVCCSKHGFCGFDSQFCNSECQNEGGCVLTPPRPQCSESTDAMAADVRIGYYGAWSSGRSCNAMEPESIAAGVLTHIYIAFEYVSAEHEITDRYGPVVGRVSRLKNIYPGLKVVIALGGWVFNDPPTQTRFSDMASTIDNRSKFIKSLIAYMRKYALNGVDIDWEYPVADDRGGIPEDYNNFVSLIADIREAFDEVDPGWEVTLTLPASYWYLRGFSIENLERYVNWFNVMTYDIHGLWDQKNVWTGPYLKGHTNLTEIEDGLDLLWRNGIRSEKVVMGFGFYGRGFTMTDTQCSKPPSCKFSGPGFPGDCTNEPGILSYSEVIGHEKQLGSQTFYDEKDAVKWMVYGSNQWISWDDAQAFERKKKYLFSRCLKGLMIWELGLDTATYDAMIALFGEEAVGDAVRDTSLNPDEKDKLAKDLAAFTGQNCYVTRFCTKQGDKGDWTKYTACAPGYSSIAVGHDPEQMNRDPLYGQMQVCEEGEFKHVCCPTDAQPRNCGWEGIPERQVIGCDQGCGASQFELTNDASIDQYGRKVCGFGAKSLCCDATDILRKCHWTDCLHDFDNDVCEDDEVSVATRYDQEDGKMCKSQTGMGNGGSDGPLTKQFFRSYCCPKSDPLEDCKWSNDLSRSPKEHILRRCALKTCEKGELEMTEAITPSTLYDLEVEQGAEVCDFYNGLPGFAYEYPLCCSPPGKFDGEWPVNPAYLWNGAHTDEDDDVTWSFANNFGNNDKDTSPADLEEDPGADPYGFVMLDGPPGSIAKAFDQQFTFVTREEPVNVQRRSLVTTNQTVLDATFDNVEETYHVYCNHHYKSKHCGEIFHKGAKDTIIKMPHHVGEGPYARVVSMEPLNNPPELPTWAIRRRSEENTHENGVYELVIDYNFAAIEPRADGDVFMRVDYTNLQEYWDDVTDEDSENNNKRKKRSDPMDFDSWKARVDKAKNVPNATAQDDWKFSTKGNTDLSPDGSVRPAAEDCGCDQSIHGELMKRDGSLEGRWYGTFVNWLKKVTRITNEDAGRLPMGLSKLFTIYSGRLRCTNGGVTITAGLDITADTSIEMGAKYAYYFSGTVVPPDIIDTFAYVGAQPKVRAGVTIRGNAELGYRSEIRRLIDTITYPGLSIKGIATVGPSLDLWGQIEASIKVSGQVRIGAEYTFEPVELYLPNNDETRDRASDKLDGLDTDQTGISPVFQANVRAELDAHLRITPELQCGITVGGRIGPLKGTLVDGRVTAFMNTSLHFNAQVTAGTDGRTSGWEYGYEVELLWRIGIAAVASVCCGYGNWRTKTYFPVDWQTIPIYGPITVKSLGGSSARRDEIDARPWLLSEEPLSNPLFGWATPAYTSDAISGDSSVVFVSNSSLARRQTAAKETEFMLGDFKCNSGSGPCSVSSNGVQKRETTTWESNSRINRLEKRAPTDCRNALPNLYYNCEGYFADITLTGALATRNVPGLCTSVRRFLTNQGIVNDQYVLTYDGANQATRRTQTCTRDRNPCSGANGDNARTKAALGAPFTGINSLVNCDEFPFASAEEGGYGYAGNAAGLSPPNPQGVTRTCVPSWHNDLQGLCNGLLVNIETNVQYFNDPANPDDDAGNADWQGWDVGGWLSKTGFSAGGTPRQRLIRYPKAMPVKLQGVNAQERADASWSWMHKRNFTLHLVSNPRVGPATFPDNQFQSGSLFTTGSNNRAPDVNTVNHAAWIICAVSTRGQDRFRYARTGGVLRHNGYCWDGVSETTAWNGVGNYQIMQYFSCDINFSGAPHRKRGEPEPIPIGYFGNEPIYSVKRSEDYKVINVKVPIREAKIPDLRHAVPLSE